MHHATQKMRQAVTIRFIENDDLEVPHPPAESLQGFALEMVDEQIRDQHAAVWRRLHLKQIPLMPLDLGVGKQWWRREIIRRYGGRRKKPCKRMAQFSISCADLDDASTGGPAEALDLATDPPFVSHEKVDASQISPAPSCLVILRREGIKNFRDYEAFIHPGPRYPESGIAQ